MINDTLCKKWHVEGRKEGKTKLQTTKTLENWLSPPMAEHFTRTNTFIQLGENSLELVQFLAHMQEICIEYTDGKEWVTDKKELSDSFAIQMEKMLPFNQVTYEGNVCTIIPSRCLTWVVIALQNWRAYEYFRKHLRQGRRTIWESTSCRNKRVDENIELVKLARVHYRRKGLSRCQREGQKMETVAWLLFHRMRNLILQHCLFRCIEMS